MSTDKNEMKNDWNAGKGAADDRDDIEFTPDESQDGLSTDARSSLEKLRKKLAACERERQEFLDGWQRSQAEVVNTRNAYERERERLHAQATRSLLERLLPVVDSFSMAISQQASWAELPGVWREGMERIYAQLLSVLEDENVSVFSPQGEQFDPALHEAVATVPVQTKEEDNVITEVVQNGYLLGDEVLRSAKVKVGQRHDESADA